MWRLRSLSWSSSYCEGFDYGAKAKTPTQHPAVGCHDRLGDVEDLSFIAIGAGIVAANA